MVQKHSIQSLICGFFLLLSVFSSAPALGQVSSTLVSALFGTAYVASFDSKEVDFYYGQIFYNNGPGSYNSFDTYSSTFGSDITLYNQDFFNWFVGTERLGRTGSGSISQSGKQYNLQWNVPVCALYSGTRFDWDEKNLLNPYVFCIGALYSISDLLGNDSLISNGSTYNITGTTLGLELGFGFTPLTFKNLQISIEGNYRFANFPNVSYSPTSSSLPPLPTGLPTGLDYSGWSVQIALSFEPSKSGPGKGEAGKAVNEADTAREKLLAGNIPYNKAAFMTAVENCDTYVVKAFLDSGYTPDNTPAILNNPKICDRIKALFQPQAEKPDAANPRKPRSNQ